MIPAAYLAHWQEEMLAALRWHLNGRLGAEPYLGAEHEFVWTAFWALSGRRSYNGAGPNPIAWAEIAAWSQIRGATFDELELEAVLALDREFIAHAYRKPGAKKMVPASGKSLSRLFRMMAGTKPKEA